MCNFNEFHSSKQAASLVNLQSLIYKHYHRPSMTYGLSLLLYLILFQQIQ